MHLREKIKRYQKKKFEKYKEINELKIADDEVYITLKIDNKDDVISKHSVKYEEVLDESFMELITKKASYIPLDYPIVLELQYKELSSENKILIRKLIRNYYKLEKIDKEMQLKEIERRTRFFLISGIIFFMIFIWLYNSELSGIMEIASFIGSFSLWEFAEILIFDQDSLKEEVIKSNYLSKIRIVFNQENS